MADCQHINLRRSFDAAPYDGSYYCTDCNVLVAPPPRSADDEWMRQTMLREAGEPVDVAEPAHSDAFYCDRCGQYHADDACGEDRYEEAI